MPCTRYVSGLLLGALLLLLVPHTGMAQERGIELKLALNEDGETYEVYMQSTDTLQTPHRTLTAQVTIKVPHHTGSDRFEIADLTSTVADTEWTQASRVDAPEEDSNADYISFDLTFPTGNQSAYVWEADEEILAFTFKNSGPCLGAVTLIEDNDPFLFPNSVNTNPGNNIDVLVIPTAEEITYIGNYGPTAAVCEVDREDLPFGLLLPVIRR